MSQHLIVLGHGEGDLGARGVSKWEREYLEDLALELEKLIKAYGLAVVIKKDINTYKRNEFRNNTKYYLQFSSVTDIHLNAFNKVTRGAEIIIPEGSKPDNRDARFFEKLKNRFGWRRWIVSNYYQQTREAQRYKIPSFRLIEYCFCDNKEDIDIYTQQLHEVAKDTLEAVLDVDLSKANVKSPQPVLYRVQTGAYTVEENAKRLAQQLKSQGFETYLVWERDRQLHKVQVGAFAKKENAINTAKKLSERGHETYIVTTGETDSVYVPKEFRYTNEEMAERVKAGHYGNGEERIKALLERGYNPTVIQEIVNASYINTKPQKEYLLLHSNVTAWRVYPVGVSRIPQNAVGILNPRLFGGLEYEILEKRENGNVAIIQTRDFGKVQIWIGPDVKSIHSLIWR